jgi:hypothetical protein
MLVRPNGTPTLLGKSLRRSRSEGDTAPMERAFPAMRSLRTTYGGAEIHHGLNEISGSFPRGHRERELGKPVPLRVLKTV